MLYFIVFIIALILTLILTPWAKKLAFLLNAIDKPAARKVHSKAMPRLGGVAIYLGFLGATVFGLIAAAVMGLKLNYLAILGILLGSVFLVGVGIVDDMKSIKAFNKLLLQAAAAMIPIIFGVQITFVSTPMTGIMLLGIFAVPFTLLWIVGMTNAANFIDGLDGLASGVAAIAGITLFIVAVSIHQPGAALLMIALTGAAAGFLRYNFNPASIFLGDSGSMFLGYMLACTAVIGVLKSTIILALLIPVFILGVPIFDTASVIMRRMRDGRHIFDADRHHLHHRLLDRGFSQRQVVLSVYAVCVLLSIGTLSVAFLKLWQAIIVLALLLAASFAVIQQIKKYVRRFVVLEKE